MGPKELKALVKTLRSLGVTSYDDGHGLKLSLTPEPPRKAPKAKLKPEKIKEIEHKLEEFTSLMKMDDKSLVDRLFPDHQPDTMESEH